MRVDLTVSRGRGLLLAIVTIIVLVADQVTKALIRANLDLHESIPAEGRFRLTYSTNSGSIFGLSLDGTFLMIVGFVAIVVILWLHFFYLRSESKLMRVGLGLVMGGAVGNLIDRVRFGEITDFIDVRLWGDFHWATFNIADASLTSGVFALLYYMLNTIRRTQNNHTPKQDWTNSTS